MGWGQGEGPNCQTQIPKGSKNRKPSFTPFFPSVLSSSISYEGATSFKIWRRKLGISQTPQEVCVGVHAHVWQCECTHTHTRVMLGHWRMRCDWPLPVSLAEKLMMTTLLQPNECLPCSNGVISAVTKWPDQSVSSLKAVMRLVISIQKYRKYSVNINSIYHILP